MSLNLEKHIIFCNLPSEEKVLLLANEIRGNKKYKKAHIVVITDDIDEIPEEFKEAGILFIKGDPTQEEVLSKANITKAEAVFVLAKDPKDITSDEKTFTIATVLKMNRDDLKELNYKIIVELVSRTNLKMMEKLKLDGIISSDGIIGCLMAQEFLSPGVNAIVQQIISNDLGSEFYIYDTNLDPLYFKDLQISILQQPEKMQLLGIIHQGKYLINPEKSTVVQKGDQLIILADDWVNFNEIEDRIRVSL